jgi:RNA polymerase sigma-70 factor (sigma-E family)
VEPVRSLVRHPGVTVVREGRSPRRTSPGRTSPGSGSVLSTGGGEPGTFAHVYATQYASLVRLAYVTVGSVPVAEDVVQEVFADLYRRFDEIVDPAPYLRRAVVSRCISWIRRRAIERRHAGRSAPLPPVPALGPDGAAVRAALARLRPRQRAAVFLRYYMDLSEVQIAEVMGCRPGTVKSLLHRGLAVLREHLDED